MSTWLLVWVLLTPGGDAIDAGFDFMEERDDCVIERLMKLEQPLPLGQKIQAACFEVGPTNK
jgi:hypothetical protein